MKSVKGVYDGKKVKLAEHVSVEREVPVIVTFLEESVEENSRLKGKKKKKKWHWEESQKLDDGFKGSIVDLLLEERRESF